MDLQLQQILRRTTLFTLIHLFERKVVVAVLEGAQHGLFAIARIRRRRGWDGSQDSWWMVAERGHLGGTGGAHARAETSGVSLRDGYRDGTCTRSLCSRRRLHLCMTERALDERKRRGSARVARTSACIAAIIGARGGRYAEIATEEPLRGVAVVHEVDVGIRGGHEAEDAAEGGDRGINRGLDAVPGVLQADEIVKTFLDLGHLVVAHRNCISDDGSSGDPCVGDCILAMDGLSLDEIDSRVGSLVDGVVGHVALLADVDS